MIMRKYVLVTTILVILIGGLCFGDVTRIPTDSTQDYSGLVYFYKNVFDRDPWRERGAVEADLCDEYGERQLLFSVTDYLGSYGAFLYPDTVSLSAPFNLSALPGFDINSLSYGYSSICPISNRYIVIFKSSVLDNYRQSVSWEYPYFVQLCSNILDLQSGSQFVLANETELSSCLSKAKILVIPAFSIGRRGARTYMDSIATYAPELVRVLTDFLSNSGTIYTEGNAAYLLEALGIVPNGTVDLSDQIDGNTSDLIAEVTSEDTRHILGLTTLPNGIYTTAGPTLSDAYNTICTYTSAFDPADIGKPAIISLNGADAHGGSIIMSAGIPALGSIINPSDRQWQWSAHALLYSFTHKLSYVRSILTDVEIESTDVAPMALPTNSADTFEVTVRARNLWSTSISNIEIIENTNSFLEYVDVVSGPAPIVDGSKLTFNISSIPANSEQKIVYRLATPPENDDKWSAINSYLTNNEYMRVSTGTITYDDPVYGSSFSASRNDIWVRFLFEANIAADTDLNWKNILGEYYQPFKIFMIMENKERTDALATKYVQYIPLDVPVYWPDDPDIPILRTPGGKFVDILQGSESEGALFHNIDGDAHPDAWLDLSTIHPYPDSLELQEIYWLNPWDDMYEDIDGDGVRAQDTDGDGVVDIEEPGDKIRAYRAVWNINTMPGYQFHDPYVSWELWLDPPPLLNMAIGAALYEGTGYTGSYTIDDTGIYYYESYEKWMNKDESGDVVLKRLVQKNRDSYRGFAFVDSDYTLLPGDVDQGWVPYPKEEYIAVLNLGGKEPTMHSPTPEKSLYSNIYYKTIWGEDKVTPIRTTYTYYTPLPNPLQFEYVAKTFQIKDPSTGEELPYLPANNNAELEFRITASTEYSYYWIRVVGKDFGEYKYTPGGQWVQRDTVKDGLGDGVFGYIIENIPKGLGGYDITLPMIDDSTYDIDAIIEDYEPFVFNDPTVDLEVQITEYPFYYSVYIPQILIPPALDDNNLPLKIDKETYVLDYIIPIPTIEK